MVSIQNGGTVVSRISLPLSADNFTRLLNTKVLDPFACIICILFYQVLCIYLHSLYQVFCIILNSFCQVF